MYFVTTKGLTGTVAGKTPVSAAAALALIKGVAGTSMKIEVRDKYGRLVTVDHLERQTKIQS